MWASVCHLVHKYMSSLSPQELCNEKNDALGLNQGCFLWLEELKLLHHVLNLAKPKHRQRKVVMSCFTEELRTVKILTSEHGLLNHKHHKTGSRKGKKIQP